MQKGVSIVLQQAAVVQSTVAHSDLVACLYLALQSHHKAFPLRHVFFAFLLRLLGERESPHFSPIFEQHGLSQPNAQGRVGVSAEVSEIRQLQMLKRVESIVKEQIGLKGAEVIAVEKLNKRQYKIAVLQLIAPTDSKVPRPLGYPRTHLPLRLFCQKLSDRCDLPLPLVQVLMVDLGELGAGAAFNLPL